jgi:hypothetical protein
VDNGDTERWGEREVGLTGPGPDVDPPLSERDDGGGGVDGHE